MNRFTSLLSACALAPFFAVVPSSAATAQETPSPLVAANCVLTAPPDWHPVDMSKQPGAVVAFADPGRDRMLMVLINQRGQAAPAVSDAYVTGFDKGVENVGGGKKTAGRFTRVAGFDAYERRGRTNIKSRDLTTVMVAIPTGDGTYMLEALSANSEAADDPEITQAFGGFRFLRPPGPPRKEPDAAYRVGYLAGLAFPGLAVLALIIWVISKASSRRSSPLPAGFSGPYPYSPTPFPPAANLPPLPPALPTTPPPLPPASC